ncbi:MAG: class I SAM-dependent methyltransferase [Bacillota bacterium]|nr:class I SAM-dependent methyltransferase [Bacillota bacterium]
MDKMDGIKAHFNEEAEQFDGIIRKLIPYYAQMVRALTDSISFDKNAQLEVIDLGCGTGTISKAIKDLYPHARLTCVDMAPNMLKMAERKLSDAPDSRFIECDFNQFDFDKKYDLIVSSLAFHHLVSDKEKLDFYRKIYGAVKDKGIFINADVVLASCDWLYDRYMERWKEYMMKEVPQKEVEEIWAPTHYREDSPISMMKHLEMLKDVGFNTLDIVWKYYNFAVYIAMK